MYTQTEKVNIRPKSYLPVFRVSEGDVGRTLTAHLVSDEGEISIPGGATVTMAGTKPSGLGYTVTGTVDGTDVSFDTDAVMTDEPGRIVSEIRIVQDGTVIGTTNVVLSVEPNPHPDDTTDGRREPLVNEITALLSQITEQADRVEEYSGKVLGMTVTAHESDEVTVTKTEGEVVNLDFGLPRGPQGIQGVPGQDGTDGVTPDFSIGAVETLAPGEQATATITGTEEDPVLNLGIPQGAKGDKGDPGEVTQEEFEKLLITDTASGEIATFPDGADFPMRSLKVSLSPIQSGSGTPSPDNVRPISGWDEVETHKAGVNVWDEEWELGQYNNATGLPISASDCIRTKNPISVKPDVTYYTTYGNGRMQAFFYKADETYIGNAWIGATNLITTPDECALMRFRLASAYGTTYNNDISINYPSTDTEYHPYDGQTITTPLPTTVYGGTVDVVNGTLTVDRASVELEDLDWSDSTSTRYISKTVPDMVAVPSSTTLPNMIAEQYSVVKWSDGLANNHDSIAVSNNNQARLHLYKDADTQPPTGKIVYELATPQTYSLTPQQIQTLLGRNNVWSDGDVSVEYVADPKRYIQKMIGE